MMNFVINIRKIAATTIATAAIVSFVTQPGTAATAKTKPVKKIAKKAPKLIREVLGTDQFVGWEGALNETFTLGKNSPVNFTLKSVEYSINRVNIGTTPHISMGDEKMLVLHFTAQNPRKTAMTFNSNILKIRAVDSGGVTREYLGDSAREVTGEAINMQLQPGQKIDGYTAIRVAAFGEVPKLIVGSWYETKAPIVRYDLRGKVRKLVVPFIDATDKSGATALKTVSARSGVWYPVVDYFDMKLEKFEYSNEKLGGYEAGSGKYFGVATFAIKNKSTRAARFAQSNFRADLKDVGGEKTSYGSSILKGSRNEEAGGELAPGEEVRVRFYWRLPEGVKAQTVLMQYGYNRDSRTYAFAVPQS